MAVAEASGGFKAAEVDLAGGGDVGEEAGFVFGDEGGGAVIAEIVEFAIGGRAEEMEAAVAVGVHREFGGAMAEGEEEAEGLGGFVAAGVVGEEFDVFIFAGGGGEEGGAATVFGLVGGGVEGEAG